MEPNGRTTACLNEGGSPRCVDQVKYSVALDRANFRFADVNGMSFWFLLSVYTAIDLMLTRLANRRWQGRLALG